ncbi:MAG: hypothetical protein ACI84R_001284, partial [Candidatus Azotimanducaceae bacterium]
SSPIPCPISRCSFEQESDIPALHRGDIIALQLQGHCYSFLLCKYFNIFVGFSYVVWNLDPLNLAMFSMPRVEI